MSKHLYSLYETHRFMSLPVTATTSAVAQLLDLDSPVVRRSAVLRRLGAMSEVVSGIQLTHDRPHLNIGEIPGEGGMLAILQEDVDQTPFATLSRFSAVSASSSRPAVLLVAPLSGHFWTMLAPTLRTLLRDHDVYVTDWHNARDIPVEEGPFGLDEYVDHVIRFLRVVGEDAHVVAVCQPCVPALAAVALLADEGEPTPKSLTLVSGPIDTRVNPTKINEAAHRRDVTWYERRCVSTVPSRYAGAGRRVYPGFLQVSAFMSLNIRRHVDAHLSMYRHLRAGRREESVHTRQFYDEYFAVLDVPSEFYLQTIERIFQKHLLPLGRLEHRGRPVRPGAIADTPVLTVEAARDDMCAVGQTHAAHALLTGLAEDQKRNYVQEGVGHYGIFSGRRWENEVYPVIRDFIRETSAG